MNNLGVNELSASGLGTQGPHFLSSFRLPQELPEKIT